jgi:hypothetical protein
MSRARHAETVIEVLRYMMLSDLQLLSRVLVSSSVRGRNRASGSGQVPAKVEKLVRVQLCALKE